MYIKFYNGRKDPNDDTDGCCFEGPVIGPVLVSGVYGHIRLEAPVDEGFEFIPTFEGMWQLDAYYGDFYLMGEDDTTLIPGERWDYKRFAKEVEAVRACRALEAKIKDSKEHYAKKKPNRGKAWAYYKLFENGEVRDTGYNVQGFKNFVKEVRHLYSVPGGMTTAHGEKDQWKLMEEDGFTLDRSDLPFDETFFRIVDDAGEPYHTGYNQTDEKQFLLDCAELGREELDDEDEDHVDGIIAKIMGGDLEAGRSLVGDRYVVETQKTPFPCINYG